MAWNQITFFATQAIAEQLSDFLSDLGAVAVTMKEGNAEEILEPLPGETPLWSDTQVVGLFEDDLDIDHILVVLKALTKALCKDLGFPKYIVEAVADEDWERAWLKDFKPMQFGENLWIVPSAYEPEDESATNIFLDPGLAFGTGTHATTALCLKWLDKHHTECKTQYHEVIDYGCGSGILAIAAAKLGANAVHGIDIDPQALIATESNSSVNKVAEHIKTYLVDEFDRYYEGKAADLLLANILANPLMELAASFAKLVKPNALIVLSGILEDQAEDVLQVYRQWFDMDEPTRQDGWVMLSGKNRSGRKIGDKKVVGKKSSGKSLM